MKISFGYFNYNALSYEVAYDCCANVIEENGLCYPLDVFSLVESYGIKIITYSKLATQYNIPFEEIVDNFSSFGFLLRDKNSCRAIIYYNDRNALETNKFTLLHELGHYLMGHFEDTKANDNLANCFARNLIAPASVCNKLKLCTPESVSSYFSISYSCSKTRLDFLKRDLENINKLGKHPMLYYHPLVLV